MGPPHGKKTQGIKMFQIPASMYSFLKKSFVSDPGFDYRIDIIMGDTDMKCTLWYIRSIFVYALACTCTYTECIHEDTSYMSQSAFHVCVSALTWNALRVAMEIVNAYTRLHEMHLHEIMVHGVKTKK